MDRRLYLITDPGCDEVLTSGIGYVVCVLNTSVATRTNDEGRLVVNALF